MKKLKYRGLVLLGIICYSLLCIKQLGDAKGLGFIWQLYDSWAILIPLIILSVVVITKLEIENIYIYTCVYFGIFIPVLLDDRVVSITDENVYILWIAFFVLISIAYFFVFKQRKINEIGKFLMSLFIYSLLIISITIIGIFVQVFIIGIALPT